MILLVSSTWHDSKQNKGASALELMVMLVSVFVVDGQPARDSDLCAFAMLNCVRKHKDNNIIDLRLFVRFDL